MVGLRGVVKGEGDSLMKDIDGRRLYNWRGHEPPTPNTKDIVNPRRLYNRRGPALPTTTTTPPPVLSNPRSGEDIINNN